MFSNNIPDQIRPYLEDRKSNIRCIVGNKIVFDSDDTCHEFTARLYEDEYAGIITQPFYYDVKARKQNVVHFVKAR